MGKKALKLTVMAPLQVGIHMCQLILGGVQSDQLTADVKESFLMTRLCVEAIRMSAQK